LADARLKIEVRLYEVDMKAEAVLAREAEDMARNYLAHLSELRETLYVLRYTGIRQVRRDPQAPRPKETPMVYNPVSAPTRQITMPQIVLTACGEDCLGASEMRGGIRVRDNVNAAVAQYWQRLRTDSTAQLKITPLPPPFAASAMLKPSPFRRRFRPCGSFTTAARTFCETPFKHAATLYLPNCFGCMRLLADSSPARLEAPNVGRSHKIKSIKRTRLMRFCETIKAASR
jgi:hypothetical protein